jgi:hypothetical protein
MDGTREGPETTDGTPSTARRPSLLRYKHSEPSAAATAQRHSAPQKLASIRIARDRSEIIPSAIGNYPSRKCWRGSPKLLNSECPIGWRRDARATRPSGADTPAKSRQSLRRRFSACMMRRSKGAKYVMQATRARVPARARRVQQASTNQFQDQQRAPRAEQASTQKAPLRPFAATASPARTLLLWAPP